MFRLLLFVSIFLFGYLPSAYAVHSEIVQRVFNVRDGLTNASINDISFDQYGFAWLATEDGLYRVSSTTVRRIDKVGLDTVINDPMFENIIPVDQHHMLATSFSNIYLYNINENQFIPLTLPNKTQEQGRGTVVVDVQTLDNGTLMLMTNVGDLYSLDTKTLQIQQVSDYELDASMRWHSFFETPSQEKIFVATKRLQIGNEHYIDWPANLGKIGKVILREDMIWLTSSVGLFNVELSSKAIKRVDGFEYNLSRILSDKEGYLWLSGRDGLMRWHPETSPDTHINYRKELKQAANIEYVNDMVIDDNGLIWVGGSGDGLALISPPANFIKQSFTAETRHQLPNEMIWAIYPESDSLWLGSDGGIMVTENNGKAKWIQPDGFLVTDSVYTIMPLDNNHLLLASTNGLFVINKHTHQSMRFSDWSGGKNSLEHEIVITAYHDPYISERIWLPSTAGLFYWQQGEADLVKVDISDAPLSHIWFNSILHDNHNRLWIGGLYFGYFDEQHQFHSMTPFLPENVEVSNMMPVRPNTLWLATIQKGIYEFDTTNHQVVNLTKKWGVECNTVYFMLQTDRSNIIGCNDSIIKQNLVTQEVKVYLNRDGFISDEFNEMAIAYRADQGLYIGTPDGLMLIDPERLSNRIVQDEIILESVTLYFDEQTLVDIIPKQGMQVAAGAGMLSFQIASLDYIDSKPLNIQYRLTREGDSVGNYLLLEGKSQINFASLTDGVYTLELIYQSNGIWSERPYVYTFTVNAFWWQTSKFKSAVLFTLILLTVLIVALRQRQINNMKAMNTALMESDERLYQALRGSDSDLWRWDTQHIYLDNRGGVLGDQETLINHVGSIPVHPDDISHAKSAWQEFKQSSDGLIDVEYRYKHADKGWRWMRVRGRAITTDDETGELREAAGIFTDITEQKELQSEVSLLVAAFENTSEGMMILDSDKSIKITNAAATLILSATEQELIGKQFSELIVGSKVPLDIDKLFAHQSYWSGERNLSRLDGDTCPVWLNISLMQNAPGGSTHYVVVFSDITERKQNESNLRRLANSDLLTGLANRSMFTRTLDQVTQLAQSSDEKLALLFLDLDRFKNVNDSYGHSMGDALLIEASRRLQTCIGPDHILCRFGGDEFVVLIRNVTSIDQINHIAEQLIQQIATPFHIQGREFFISTSIGISLWPDDAQTPEALIQNADLAMYHAKEDGLSQFRYYSAERNAEALYHLRLEADLRKALEQNEFELYYQPQIDILNGDKVIGMEALIRWQHPKDGFIPPDVFIGVAESCGLIVDIDRWVIRQACTDGARWQAIYNEPFHVSVNISAVHFRQPDFIKHLTAVISETGISPDNLAVEITEGVLMKELNVAKEHLAELKNMRIQVAIDDFGTGYSSLAYLSSFDVNVLKIDRSFLINIADNAVDQAITSSIIELARNLKLNVVAEGVETQEQLEQVFSRGCYVIQGYYFSKPLPVAELEQYLLKN
ncbi:EAL domain-containing protein [Shewanella maritima]|uniref:EAL domain-containing protein n=1 Tax=Shewanella maritima TaxID=2520507 RepID=UPI0037353274